MSENKSSWQLLRNKYPEGECVLMEEVSDITGGRNRSADFIVVNLWPSRGNSIIGFERKSYRNDWLREMKMPEKQEAIYQYCNYFYLLTDKENVAKLEEIPVNWGWVHNDGTRLKTMKVAPSLTPIACSKKFICAMLRRAASKEGFVHVDTIKEKLDTAEERGALKAANTRDFKIRAYDSLMESINEFETASGIKIAEKNWRFDPKKTGEALKLVLDGEIPRLEDRIKKIQKDIALISEAVQPIFNKIELCHDKKNNHQITLG